VIRTSKFTKEDLEGKEKPDVKDIITEFLESNGKIQALENKIDVGIYCFERSTLKDEKKDCAMSCLKKIEEGLPAIIERRALDYIGEIGTSLDRLSQPTFDVENFIDFLKYYEDSKTRIDTLDDERQSISDLATLLRSDEVYKIKAPEGCRLAMEKMRANHERLKKIREEIEHKMDSEKNKYKKELQSLMPTLEDMLKVLVHKLSTLNVNNSAGDAEAMEESLRKLSYEVNDLMTLGHKWTKFQEVLEMEVSRIDKIEEFNREFKVYFDFWSTKSSWKNLIEKLMDTAVRNIVVDEIQTTLDKNIKTVNVCQKELEGNEMFKTFKEEITRFKSVITILISFREPALGEAQWKEIKDLIASDESITFEDFKIEDFTFKLKNIYEMKVMNFNEQISGIAVRAAKEKELLTMLDGIKSFIARAVILTCPYKDQKETFILEANDD
jgi:hypothetical protein